MAKSKFKFKSWMVVGLVVIGLIFVLWPMVKGSGIGQALNEVVPPRGASWW